MLKILFKYTIIILLCTKLLFILFYSHDYKRLTPINHYFFDLTLANRSDLIFFFCSKDVLPVYPSTKMSLVRTTATKLLEISQVP